MHPSIKPPPHRHPITNLPSSESPAKPFRFNTTEQDFLGRHGGQIKIIAHTMRLILERVDVATGFGIYRELVAEFFRERVMERKRTQNGSTL
ncbi:hypothetical protein JTE90_009068 [Oedothorax gibbosus]|uniref:Uncharacterized protein n=1 Tax=Oedothorax gibbosus TaxID=931172 RepID=A0AAV6UZT4_9ARAC|nr:hypothetical protein JTE90_009068 [Oedothorax gibbosus]